MFMIVLEIKYFSSQQSLHDTSLHRCKYLCLNRYSSWQTDFGEEIKRSEDQSDFNKCEIYYQEDIFF
jgi:hypothetical protein